MEDVLARLIDLSFVDKAKTVNRLLAHINVICNGKLFCKNQFLVDYADAVTHGIHRAVQADLLSFKFN